MPSHAQHYLVKMAPRKKGEAVSFSVGETKCSLVAEPLMPAIDRGKDRGAAPSLAWHLLKLRSGPEVSPWDMCHAMTSPGGKWLAAGPRPVFAEPDLEQQWTFQDKERSVRMAVAECEEAAKPDKDAPYPRGGPRNWFRGQRFSQLERASAQVWEQSHAERIRIAHLDTGFDPDHSSKPEHVNQDLWANFVDKGEPYDRAEDDDRRGACLMRNYGHGTGTLGILAGRPDGGAPEQEIVPIRVANGVVLFKNSAIAKAFNHIAEKCLEGARIDVVTMSMGGLASGAWADAVNTLYEMGVFIVTAAGNNYGNFPTRHLVFPARFGRVAAACGVMADGRPYADRGLLQMAGNYGPESKMGTALAAYTPNTPWARIDCRETVDKDGRGTSSATPQVAAAAALWLQMHKQELETRGYYGNWRQAEAARQALFGSAAQVNGLEAFFGRGILRAADALGVGPADKESLSKQPEDKVRFPLLSVLLGLGAAAGQSEMFEQEAIQLVQQNRELEELLPEPEVEPGGVSLGDKRRILECLRETSGASNALRERIGEVLGSRPRGAPPKADSEAGRALSLEMERRLVGQAVKPPLPEVFERSLHVYAFDPLSVTQLETRDIARTELKVRWEPDLKPGPVGEYLEVVDYDPASGCCYAPVDLNAREILASGGVVPSESNPWFHQQMVYAWCMKTIDIFETALGRKAFWAPKLFWDGKYDARFVKRLKIFPHALREANAYYSPHKLALLFGYFNAEATETGRNLPGGTVFTCLSHDIVAHETTHALLDGLHRRYRDDTGPDCLAFHEAFADIVALFQHFMLPDALLHQVKRTRGDLGDDNLLAKLAVQFGQGIGNYGALRNAIGETDEHGEFVPRKPRKSDYREHGECHKRGSVLVAAVFDAFLQIYDKRCEDLIRLATGGTGVLPEGAISEVLARKLAQEAGDTAEHILTICIRALDYCPPVDITFGDYLRALVTADHDLNPVDELGYRTAFISAFERRGIYPENVRNLSEDSLRWEPPRFEINGLEECLGKMKLDWGIRSDREAAYNSSKKSAYKLWRWIKGNVEPAKARELGLVKIDGKKEDYAIDIDGRKCRGVMHGIEVHSVRPARRVGRKGEHLSELVIDITQKWVYENAAYRGGCSVIVDAATGRIRYFIRIRTASPSRVKEQMEFRAGAERFGLRSVYFDEFGTSSARMGRAETFAMVHRAKGE